MSYLTFHLLFIVPPLAVLLLAVPAARRRFGNRALWTLPAVAAIALVYTTPWDNYLVYRGVWFYGADRVLGTIGYVPVEEYMFFLLQPLLTGAWMYALLLRGGGAWLPAGTGVRAGEDVTGRTSAPAAAGTADLLIPAAGPRAVGVGVYLLLAACGLLALTYSAGLYLGLILVWAAPVLAAQWYFIAPAAVQLRGRLALAIAVPTLYLWAADRVALGLGIWTIAPEHITGVHLFGLPLEEAAFFLITNVLVVQGVLLFLQPVLERAAVEARPRLVAAA
jgi:lycopene beta-cyclase